MSVEKNLKKKSANTKKSTKKSKPKRRFRYCLIGSVFSIIAFILSVFFVVQVLKLNILPMHLVLPLSAIVICMAAILLILMNFITKGKISKLICGVLSIALCIGLFVGNNYLYKTSTMFDSVTNLTSQITNTVSVLVMNESGLTSLDQLEGKTVATVAEADSDATKRCLKDIKKEDVNIETVDFTNYAESLGALFNHEVDAMLLNEAYRGALHEIEGFTGFANMTTSLHKTIYYTPREHVLEASKDAVNVVSEPFTVLISGNDSYGSLQEVSRSDVNMLVTINPKSHTILMTSIPRDYYLPVACPPDVKDCPKGQNDKLTHTGLYGVSTTEKTIEASLDIDINYYVRVNFSSLVNLVDALGGIDVDVPEGLEVETFYANGTPGVHAGINHLDGERALAFARERKAYQDGDIQRNKNQQQVLMQMVRKIASPDMIVNFGKFMDALSGAFETNMSADNMLSLIRYEFTFFPDWKFEQYNVDGYQDILFCPILGTEASVNVGNTQAMEIAKDKIQAVCKGKSSNSVKKEVDPNIYSPFLEGVDDMPMPQQSPVEEYIEEEPVYYGEPQYSDEVPYVEEGYEQIQY